MIEFYLNNERIKTNANKTTTLLDFVRYQQRQTGVKIGCREGDCGACSVLVGTLQEDKTVVYKSITSCISPLGNAHGKHIVTVEGTNLLEELTTVQKAMKDNYATQCGFCTPGFVVSLTGFSLSDSEKNIDNTLNAISGNVCRCTGYKSIVNAANEVCQKLSKKDEKAPVEWLVENDFIPEYFKTIPQKLSNLQTIPFEQTAQKFVSGGTDLYVQQADNLEENSAYLIAEHKELKGISIENGICKVGANNTVSDFWNHIELNTYFPKLRQHLKLVSSEQIRNMASFGGNLVNASPIGDMTIFFLALNSELTILEVNQKERTTPLNQFYKGYKTYDLEEGALVKSIHFKVPNRNTQFNFEKVCKRQHLDIASVNSAMSIEVEGNRIVEAHAAVGGVSAIPKYLHKTSAFLKGKELTLEVIAAANEILQEEISPISDVRETSDYKRLLARQLFFAHFITLFPSVFSLDKLVQYA